MAREEATDLPADIGKQVVTKLRQIGAQLGYRLTERKLAPEFNVSRSPARLALNLLAERGAITPWNFLNAMITRKVAPALAAGFSIVIQRRRQSRPGRWPPRPRRLLLPAHDPHRGYLGDGGVPQRDLRPGRPGSASRTRRRPSPWPTTPSSAWSLPSIPATLAVYPDAGVGLLAHHFHPPILTTVPPRS